MEGSYDYQRAMRSYLHRALSDDAQESKGSIYSQCLNLKEIAIW